MTSRDPNNLFWKENKSNFGFKMLEKLGWQEGNGLGAQQHGRTDFVRVKKKDDNKGIGEVGVGDTRWKAGNAAFTSVLSKLKAVKSPAGSAATSPAVSETTSPVSSEPSSPLPGLEIRKGGKLSKKAIKAAAKAAVKAAKAMAKGEKKKDKKVKRVKQVKPVVYQRRVHNKNAAAYSDHDMAAILGHEDHTFARLHAVHAAKAMAKSDPSMGDGDDTAEAGNAEDTVKEMSMSVNDYFAAKMAAIKAKKHLKSLPDVEPSPEPEPHEPHPGIGLGQSQLATFGGIGFVSGGTLKSVENDNDDEDVKSSEKKDVDMEEAAEDSPVKDKKKDKKKSKKRSALEAQVDDDGEKSSKKKDKKDKKKDKKRKRS